MNRDNLVTRHELRERRYLLASALVCLVLALLVTVGGVLWLA